MCLGRLELHAKNEVKIRTLIPCLPPLEWKVTALKIFALFVWERQELTVTARSAMPSKSEADTFLEDVGLSVASGPSSPLSFISDPLAGYYSLKSFST